MNPSVTIIAQFPQQWVFSLCCAVAWSWSGKDPGSQQSAGEAGVC